MAQSQLDCLLRHIRKILAVPEAAPVTDRQLLHCFAVGRDETAFAVLLQRHGRMVWGVCRRVLGHAEDAEDAFQATFLVLAHKAGSSHWQASVGSWLHEVAARVAAKAKARHAPRRALPRKGVVMTPDPAAEAAGREVLALLDEEVCRLPEKYRLPVVLCDLEGVTRADAARQLGWKEGTVAGRLARARALLQQRLAGRGVTLSAGGAASLLAETAAAAVPAELLTATVQAAGRYGTLQLAANGLPVGVAALVKGMVNEMFLTRLKSAAVCVLVALLGVGAMVYGYHAPTDPGAPARPDAPEPKAKKAGKDPEPRTELRRINPVVLAPVEFQATPLHVQVRQLVIAVQGQKTVIGVMVPPGEGGPATVEFVDVTAIPANAQLAEMIVPRSMVIVSASFPFRTQLEVFRDALRQASVVALARTPELAPKFVGLDVRRRTVDNQDQELVGWEQLDLEASYKPLRAAAAGQEPEPADVRRVIFSGLVMPRPMLARGGYPPLRLPTLEKSMRALEKAQLQNAPGPNLVAEASAAESVIPDHCLVRFVDVTVQPGTRYQYQLRIRLANPNHGKEDLVAWRSLADRRELDSPWAPDWPFRVLVPKD